MNRAERRRIEKYKDTSQTVKEAQEKKELENAEKALLSEIEEHHYNELDTFLSLLVIWQQAETQCSIARENYQIAHELGSQDKEQWVKIFSEAKKKRNITEPKMVAMLRNLNNGDAESALKNQFAIPGIGTICCPKLLADKLRVMLAVKEEHSIEHNEV